MTFFRFQHHYNNWFWIWRYYQLAPLLPVYPPFPHGNRWLCWINCRWTQDYSRPHPFKIAKNQILSILSPHRVLTLHVNQTVIDKDTQHKILKYFVIYAMILLALIFIVSLDSNDFLVVTSAVFSCFNNIGPILGTTSSFSIFSPISKFSSPLQ